MSNVDFDKASLALPAYCIALLQNLDKDLPGSLRTAIDGINKSGSPNRVKSLILGLELMNIVGPDLLTSAVKALGDDIVLEVTTQTRGAARRGTLGLFGRSG